MPLDPSKFPNKKLDEALSKNKNKKALDLVSRVLTESNFEDFLSGLKRSKWLVIIDGDVSKIKSTSIFFDNVTEVVYECLDNSYRIKVKEVTELLNYINDCFITIINYKNNAVDEFENSNDILPAILYRLAKDSLTIQEKTISAIHEKIVTEKNIYASEGVEISDDAGLLGAPDSAFQVLTDAASLILKDIGYSHQLYDSKGYLRLNDFSIPDDVNIEKAGLLLQNAMVWNYFNDLQSDIRLHDRSYWIHKDNSELPTEYQKYAKELLEINEPSSWRVYEIIAQARLKQFTHDKYWYYYAEYDRGAAFLFPENSKLSKKEFLSVEEAASSEMLSRLLAFSIHGDEKKYAGITLEEWVRGYSTLQQLAREKFVDNDESSLILYMTKDDVFNSLIASGLSPLSSSAFIENVCFGKKSVDLFDNPLIKSGNGFFLIAYTVIYATIHDLVISSLSKRTHYIEEKGNCLESRVIDLLESRGFNPKSIKENINNEEFQFDAVFFWEGKLFLFECKNCWLSGLNPVISYNRFTEFDKYLSQVLRLKQALIDNPFILKKYFGDNVVEEIVPCIVNGLPISLDFCVEGVFYSDYNSIDKFFSSRYVKEFFGKTKTKVYDQWGQDRPKVEDFLFHLGMPYQVALKKKALEARPEMFPLGDKKCVAVVQYVVSHLGVEGTREFFVRQEEVKRNSLPHVVPASV